MTAGPLTAPRALFLSGTGRYADPWHPFAETSKALAGLLLEAGFGVSSTSFLDSPEWAEALGGRWIRGTSMHPEYGPAGIHVHRGTGPLVEGVTDVELLDERYSYLQTAPAITVHATHTHEGLEHPVMWSWDRRPGRTFYDALGHDAASFQSPEHRQLLLRAIAWLAAG